MKKNIKVKYVLLVFIPILLIMLSIILQGYSNEKTKEENKNENPTLRNYKINDIKGYIYKNLSFSENYKFVGAKSNSVGDVLYVYQLYKSKGTLLVYINLASNSIGHRIVNEIKVPSTFAINNNKEILINTFAGGNKFYYISTKEKLFSFESPSFNLSEPFASKSFFYWLGYKYNEKKKIDKKINVFRYKNKKTENFDISKIIEEFKKQKMIMVQIKFLDEYILFNLYNKSSKNFHIFLYNLDEGKLDEIYKGNEVLIDYSISDDPFLVDNKGEKIVFYKLDLLAKDLKEIFSIDGDMGKLSYFKMLYNSNTSNYLILSLSPKDYKKEEERYINLVINNSKVVFKDKAPAIMDGYYEKRLGKIGYFYLFKDFLGEVIF